MIPEKAEGVHFLGAYELSSQVKVARVDGFVRRRAGLRTIHSGDYGYTWRFMGSYKLGCKSPNMGYNYRYPTYNPTYNYP